MSKSSVFDTMMEDLFGSFNSKTVKKTVTETTESSVPKTYGNTSDETGMTLNVDLPGIDPKSLAVKVGDGKVVVEGMNGHNKTFTQTYTISNDFDVKTSAAQWLHGRLKVRITRRKSVEPVFTKINIEIKS